MGRTMVKVCGITRVEDALAAARLGADFVGLILHADSPRRIDLARAKAIVAALPRHVRPVGVFVDAPGDQLRQTCRSIGLTHVQLHGDEPAGYVQGLRGVHVWKVLRSGTNLVQRITDWKSQRIDAILLDSARGGSGEANNWDQITDARPTLGAMRFIAAGGLTPANVAPVVRALRPWAVDVSSGVESETKGVKSAEKIEAFVRAVRAADLVPSPRTSGEG